MKRKNLFLTLVLVLALSLMFSACSEKKEEEPDHAHGDYEWLAEFELVAGEYLFHFGESEDETMDVAFIKLGDNITDLDHHAAHIMTSDKERLEEDSSFVAKPDYAYTFVMGADHGHFTFTIEEDGTYAIATEHQPWENDMQIFNAAGEELEPTKVHEVDHDHEH